METFCKQFGYYFFINYTNMAEQKKEKDSCWKNYEQIGIKTKNGRKVPNCVPKKTEKTKK